MVAGIDGGFAIPPDPCARAGDVSNAGRPHDASAPATRTALRVDRIGQTPLDPCVIGFATARHPVTGVPPISCSGRWIGIPGGGDQEGESGAGVERSSAMALARDRMRRTRPVSPKGMFGRLRPRLRYSSARVRSFLE